MLQTQIILQHFYKILMWLTSYWFSSSPTINITFSFTNNHLSYQQFVKKIYKIVCISSIILSAIPQFCFMIIAVPYHFLI